ncbi:MAG: hypothetical protein MJK04_04060, partial [Psychrosphaera sp.]|nr:hypothetical protein [Psychrosphaera sp.]
IKKAVYSCVNTLGISEGDMRSLPWVELEQQISQINGRMLSAADEDVEAKSFSKAMDEQTWLILQERMTEVIANEIQADFKAKLRLVWKLWRDKLNKEPDLLAAFLTDLMVATGESKGIHADLRIGPRTVDLMAEGIRFNILVIAALGEQHDSWDRIANNTKVKTISLKYWSGPATAEPRVQRLDEEVPELLGKEHAPIIILSGVESSSEELMAQSMADDGYSQYSMTGSKRPKLLVTNSWKIRHMLKKQSFEDFRLLLTKEFEDAERARDASIGRIYGGLN